MIKVARTKRTMKRIAADSEGSKFPYTLSKVSTDLYIEVAFDKASTLNHFVEFNLPFS